MRRTAFAGWEKLNRERQALIVKKHGPGLLPDETRRLAMLQSIAGAVADYMTPRFAFPLYERNVVAVAEKKGKARR